MKSISIIAVIFLMGIHVQKGADSDVCLSQEEMKLYNLIMEYRKEKGLAPIPLSSRLTRVAQLHVSDLNEHYTFGDGKCNPHSWSKHGKWTACCYTDDHKQAKCMWNKPGEIAGYSGNGYEIAYLSTAGANAREALAGWKVSPGHNPLLINTGIWKDVTWRAIGVGIEGTYGVVWFGEVPDDLTPKECN